MLYSALKGMGILELSLSNIATVYQTQMITNYGFGGILVTVTNKKCGIINENGFLVSTTTSTTTMPTMTPTIHFNTTKTIVSNQNQSL